MEQFATVRAVATVADGNSRQRDVDGLRGGGGGVALGGGVLRVRLECVDERGRTTECNSTEAVLRGFNQAGEQIGFRGALDRLIQRMFGGDGS